MHEKVHRHSATQNMRACAPRGAAFAPPRALSDGAHRARRPRRAVARASDDDDAVGKVFRDVYVPDRGKEMFFGVFQRDVDRARVPDEATRAELRREASKQLVNIGAAERERRMDVGKGASALSALVVVGQLATGATRLERLAVMIPLFFALGFVGSAKTGL